MSRFIEYRLQNEMNPNPSGKTDVQISRRVSGRADKTKIGALS